MADDVWGLYDALLGVFFLGMEEVGADDVGLSAAILHSPQRLQGEDWCITDREDGMRESRSCGLALHARKQYMDCCWEGYVEVC